jgi:oxalate decarboxylase
MVPKEDPLYIFASALPTHSPSEDIAEVEKHATPPRLNYSFKASDMKPTHTNQFGEVSIVDSRNFPASSKISAGIVTLKPDGVRELHWHPTVSEWQYWIQGAGRMTVFGAQQNARTMNFRANDVGFVPAMAGHCIENIGEEDLVFLELFAFPTLKRFL